MDSPAARFGPRKFDPIGAIVTTEVTTVTLVVTHLELNGRCPAGLKVQEECREKVLCLVVLVLLGMQAFSSMSSADMVYHSERLLFLATGQDGHPELKTGFIVNVHPNGPVLGARQQYAIQGARPNTAYSIVETVFEGCSEDDAQLLALPRGILRTDKHGNGQTDFVISAEELAPYSGLTIGASWSLNDGGVIAYRTRCTIGTID